MLFDAFKHDMVMELNHVDAAFSHLLAVMEVTHTWSSNQLSSLVDDAVSLRERLYAVADILEFEAERNAA